MIKPTVGRVVWYHAGRNFPGIRVNGESAPLAAHVARVIDDKTLNLMVIDATGAPFPMLNVPLVQEGEGASGSSGWCEWMPYQKGQAAKTEELEAKLAEAKD